MKDIAWAVPLPTFPPMFSHPHTSKVRKWMKLKDEDISTGLQTNCILKCYFWHCHVNLKWIEQQLVCFSSILLTTEFFIFFKKRTWCSSFIPKHFHGPEQKYIQNIKLLKNLNQLNELLHKVLLCCFTYTAHS